MPFDRKGSHITHAGHPIRSAARFRYLNSYKLKKATIVNLKISVADKSTLLAITHKWCSSWWERWKSKIDCFTLNSVTFNSNAQSCSYSGVCLPANAFWREYVVWGLWKIASRAGVFYWQSNERKEIASASVEWNVEWKLNEICE